MYKDLSPPYRAPNGNWYSRALFYDFWINRPQDQREYNCVFTLYDVKPNLICCRTTFVELNDPTGYKWAIKYLGDYAHFQYLLKRPWFKEAYDLWNEELEMKVRSEALDHMRDLSAGGNQAAAKYLADLTWKNSQKRGRPSRAEIESKAAEVVQARDEQDEDAERIGLRVIQGGKGST